MSKRKSDQVKEERWLKKMKKYEFKLQQIRTSRGNRIVYSSDEEHDINEDHVESETAVPSVAAGYVVECIADVHNDEIPTPPCDQVEGSAEEQNSAAPATISTSISLDTVADAVITTTDTDAIINTVDVPSATADTPSTSIGAASTDADCYDPELLRALGKFEADTVEWGDNIHNDIAKHFQHILLTGLKKEAKEEFNKKYLFPKNVPFAKAPTLNPEIAAMLTEACRNRDKRILAKQEQIGRALSALGKAMTTLLKKESNVSEAIRTLNDAGKLIADAHFAETDTRRSVIIPLVDKSLIDPFKDRKRDSLLFGEKLGDLVKNSRGINKTGKLIQAPSTSSASNSSLNWTGPSPRPRLQRGGQSYASRAGGQRGSYNNRRRAAPVPAPAARRQALPPPPPPPPPARRQPAQAPRPFHNQRLA